MYAHFYALKRNDKDNETLQLILSHKFHDIAFKGLHSDLGHLGRDRTVALFQDRFVLARDEIVH